MIVCGIPKEACSVLANPDNCISVRQMIIEDLCKCKNHSINMTFQITREKSHGCNIMLLPFFVVFSAAKET